MCKIQVVDGQGRYLNLLKAFIRYSPSIALSIESVISNYYMFTFPGFQKVTNSALLSKMHFVSPLKPLSDILTSFFLVDIAVVLFNRRKRAIHDYLAGSFCIKKVKG